MREYTEIPVQDLIKRASSVRINPAFAEKVSPPTQLSSLIVDAFLEKIPEGWYTQMLRDLYHRLQYSQLSGAYVLPEGGDLATLIPPRP